MPSLISLIRKIVNPTDGAAVLLSVTRFTLSRWSRGRCWPVCWVRVILILWVLSRSRMVTMEPPRLPMGVRRLLSILPTTPCSWSAMITMRRLPRFPSRIWSSATRQVTSTRPPFCNLSKSIQSSIPNFPLNTTNGVNIGGLEVVDNELIGTFWEYYAGSRSDFSHFTLSSTNLATANVEGLYQVGDASGGYVGGYMTAVPEQWQDELGMPYLTGQAAINIISQTSAGPAAFGFDPDTLGSGTAPAINYLSYPLAHPLAPVSSTNPLFNLASEITGVIFPENSDSIIFFGRHGTGQYCYGTGSACGDPTNPYQGTHAYPYEYQAWAYDVHDLIDAKNGLLESWEVQPYDVWTFELPIDVSSKQIGGVTYDSQTGRVYVSQQRGDGAYPVINVFQLPIDSSGNQAPQVNNQSFTINENSSSGVPVGTVSASDPENSPLTFAILAGNTNNAVRH